MKYKAPKNGEKIYYKNEYVGDVIRVDDNLCWVNYETGPNPFIWRFKKSSYQTIETDIDGYYLNELHDWKGKHDKT